MIWIIGGTSDANRIVENLLLHNIKNVIVTTATKFGGDLVPNGVKSESKALDLEEMKVFIEANKIELIIDASHPYAENVSQNAMKIADAENVEYWRYEREEVKEDYGVYVDSYEKLIEYINEEYKGKRIFSTLGSNNLHLLKKIDAEVFIRILPEASIIQKAKENGFSIDNIIAMKGPFGKAFNKELFKMLNIDCVLTKESGRAGGQEEKIEACRDLEIPVVILSRPRIEYKNKFDNIDHICKEIRRKYEK